MTMTVSEVRGEIIDFASHLFSLEVPKEKTPERELLIGEIADKAMSYLKKYNDLHDKSFEARRVTYKKLLTGLEKVGKDLKEESVLDKTKKIFISVSEKEKKFVNACLQTEKYLLEAEQLKVKAWNGTSSPSSFFSLLDRHRTEIAGSVSEEMKTEDWMLKRAAFRVLGDQSSSLDLAHGDKSSRAVLSIIEDVNALKAKFSQAKRGDFSSEISRLEKMAKALEKGLTFENEFFLAFSRMKSPFCDSTESILADLSYQIAEDISALGDGESLLIPTTFLTSTDPHAVALSVKRTGMQYRLTLFNSGFGASQADKDLYSMNGRELIFTGLSLAQVADEEFIAEILRHKKNHYFMREIDQEMRNRAPEQFLKSIHDHFAKFGAKGELGRRHQLQTNGTCVYDSIRMWQEYELDPYLFQMYRVLTLQETERYLKGLPYNYRASYLMTFGEKTLREERQKLKALLDTDSKSKVKVYGDPQVLAEGKRTKERYMQFSKELGLL